MERWVLFHSMKEKNVPNDLRFLSIRYVHKCQYFTEFTDIIFVQNLVFLHYFPIFVIFLIYSTCFTKQLTNLPHHKWLRDNPLPNWFLDMSFIIFSPHTSRWIVICHICVFLSVMRRNERNTLWNLTIKMYRNDWLVGSHSRASCLGLRTVSSPRYFSSIFLNVLI